MDISPGAIWALVRIDEHGPARSRAMAEEDGIPPERINQVITELHDRQLLAGRDGEAQITRRDVEHTQRIVTARRELLDEALGDPEAQRGPSCLPSCTAWLASCAASRLTARRPRPAPPPRSAPRSRHRPRRTPTGWRACVVAWPIGDR